jgi:hypothetical protein
VRVGFLIGATPTAHTTNVADAGAIAHAGVSELANFERNGPRRLRAGENTRAVSRAVQLEPLGETDRDRFPRHVSTPAFFQLDVMGARLDQRASFKTGLKRGFFSRNLSLKLREAIAEREKQLKL